MIEMNEAALAAALRELAFEDQAAIDQAFDVVAASARGLPLSGVEALLRDELMRRGVKPDDDTHAFARQIAAAVDLRA